MPRRVLAHLLVIAGGLCIVAAAFLARGPVAGLLALGVALLAYGLLGVDVDRAPLRLTRKARRGEPAT